jgi:hypothetical protein
VACAEPTIEEEDENEEEEEQSTLRGNFTRQPVRTSVNTGDFGVQPVRLPVRTRQRSRQKWTKDGDGRMRGGERTIEDEPRGGARQQGRDKVEDKVEDEVF